jgi:phosphatidate cytidylyltransferase
MLAQRIATALVLLVILIAAMASKAVWALPLMLGVMTVAGAWEWARLSGVSASAAGVTAALFALVLGLSVMAWGLPAITVSATNTNASTLWWALAAAWVVMGAALLRLGVVAWSRWPVVLRLVVGGVALMAVWWSLLLSAASGLNFLMSVMMLVWMSDVAAYFGGRALGGKVFGARKLAPSISPGKTWEGAICGALGALALAVVWVVWVDRHLPVDGPSFYTRVVQASGWGVMAAWVVVLVIMGVVGDLVESLIKRAAGAKDSSRLLPGHGGVLDRVDALLPVVPIAWAVAGRAT